LGLEINNEEISVQSQKETLSKDQKLTFAAFLAVYWIIGFVLAVWVGLGWLMLFQAIQSLVFTFPPLYLLMLQLLLGKEAREKEEIRLAEKGSYKIMSWRLAIRTIFAILLTILFFWKINIPIIQFIRMIFR